MKLYEAMPKVVLNPHSYVLTPRAHPDGTVRAHNAYSEPEKKLAQTMLAHRARQNIAQQSKLEGKLSSYLSHKTPQQEKIFLNLMRMIEMRLTKSESGYINDVFVPEFENKKDENFICSLVADALETNKANDYWVPSSFNYEPSSLPKDHNAPLLLPENYHLTNHGSVKSTTVKTTINIGNKPHDLHTNYNISQKDGKYFVTCKQYIYGLEHNGQRDKLDIVARLDETCSIEKIPHIEFYVPASTVLELDYNKPNHGALTTDEANTLDAHQRGFNGVQIKENTKAQTSWAEVTNEDKAKRVFIHGRDFEDYTNSDFLKQNPVYLGGQTLVNTINHVRENFEKLIEIYHQKTDKSAAKQN